ncbi:MAG: hypothetical protein KME52_00395 [Desmonostoc geniculatum HA4340-LM1]|jgi:hypothetical protein|nr:hypothetical protein [Desmonostoc geniculatum HA4340-LM1]
MSETPKIMSEIADLSASQLISLYRDRREAYTLISDGDAVMLLKCSI